MVRYYGYYSNVSRAKCQQEGMDDAIPCVIEPQGNVKACRKSWARLIQKIYETDPLVCPGCNGTMRIISSIEDPSMIREILKHPGLWLIRARPPPKIHIPWGHDAASCPPEQHDVGSELVERCPQECAAYDLQPQAHADTIYGDPEYSRDAYIQS